MHRILGWLVAAPIVLAAGCLVDEPGSPPTPGATPLGVVHDDVYVTGAFNNRIRIDGDRALIVVSGDNRVEIVELSTCGSSSDSCTHTASAVFPPFSSPWDVTTDGNGTLYSTLLFGGAGNGAVIPASVADGAVDAAITDPTDFAAPQGAQVVGDRLYVGNTALACDMNGCTWGDAFVTVVDLSSGMVDGTIGPLPFKNPFDLQVYDGELWVVCTGAFDASYLPASDGGLVVIDPDTDAIVDSINLGRVAPGPNLAIVDALGFLASSAGPLVLEVDLDNRTVLRGEDDPIVVSEAATFTSYVEAGASGRVYVSSFNEDFVHVLDAATGTLVDVDPSTPEIDAFVVGPGGATPAGPIALARWSGPGGTEHVLVLNTLANAMSDIVLTP